MDPVVKLTYAFGIQTKTVVFGILKASYLSAWRFLREGLGVRLKMATLAANSSAKRHACNILHAAGSFSTHQHCKQTNLQSRAHMSQSVYINTPVTTHIHVPSYWCFLRNSIFVAPIFLAELDLYCNDISYGTRSSLYWYFLLNSTFPVLILLTER